MNPETKALEKRRLASILPPGSPAGLHCCSNSESETSHLFPPFMRSRPPSGKRKLFKNSRQHQTVALIREPVLPMLPYGQWVPKGRCGTTEPNPKVRRRNPSNGRASVRTYKYLSVEGYGALQSLAHWLVGPVQILAEPGTAKSRSFFGQEGENKVNERAPCNLTHVLVNRGESR